MAETSQTNVQNTKVIYPLPNPDNLTLEQLADKISVTFVTVMQN